MNPAGDRDVEARRNRARPRWRRVQWSLAIAALVHPLAQVVAPWSWRADLLTHFQALALVPTVLAATALLPRHRRIACAFGLLAAIQVEPLVRYSWPAPVAADEASPARLRVLLANVLWDNPDHVALIRLIQAERPDVVGLIEVTEDWLSGLEPLRHDYPYRVEAPGGAQGLALWFKAKPLSTDGPRRPTPGAWPYLHASFLFAGRARDLWLVHPSSPMHGEARRDGAPELAALGHLIGSVEGSRIVIGDMNTTSGSPHFAAFLRSTGLRDSRLGFGVQPSWPSGYPYRIAIDHAFVSDDLAVTRRTLGPDIGSDHRPLLVELAPAANAAEKAPSQSSQSSP